MPDADPGDVFLHHRGAILDALLSDPYFGHVVADEPAPQMATGDSAERSAAERPVVAVDESLFDLPAPVSPVDDPAMVGVGPDESRPRRPPRGSSSSDRINALLSGQNLGPGPDFVPDYADAAAERITRDAPPNQEATEQTAARETAGRSTGERPSPQEIAHQVGAQLRKPKVALAVAAVVALLIVVLLVATGGKDDQDNRPLAVAPAPPTTPAQQTPPQKGEAGGTIEVESAKANCPPGSTDAMDAFSGEPGKAWSCVRAYKVDGQVMRIDLGKEYKVDSIGIVPGWDHIGSDGTDQWTKFRTVSRVSYELNDKNKTTYTQETLDQRSLVVTRIEPPIEASEIVLTVLESNGESAENAVAISSIVITGR
ncbi:discoidin domain-containing protein [Nocardia brevicatena]|uniref:discoidin domain-containing protein n=1 Tax=Nocardia brevicatena TaxID=37327 RepID=UPI00031000C4|nr:discoidin domain-containing protein [Nocardia brevicatena]